MKKYTFFLLGLSFAVAACAPKKIHEEPIVRQGDRIPGADATVEAARREAEYERRIAEERRGQLMAAALTDCEPDICAAVTRGEVVLGMNEAQVLAATRTTEEAWTARRTESAGVMVPRTMQSPPRDLIGQLVMVQLRDGRVGSYSYMESQGVRVVSSPEDATTVGRADALAEMLIREGDDLVARGDLEGALNRFDRASILRMGDPLLDYRIATILDQMLRPVEALIRYQLFLHRLDLERIEAVGDAYAKMAEAIAHARQRVIVLERQVR